MKTKTAGIELSPELADVMVNGLPGTVDSNEAENSGITRLVEGILTRRQHIRARSVTLYQEWVRLPNVTLIQGACLLLEIDPLDLHAQDSLQQLALARVQNRLECEVGRSLLPLEPYFANLPLRFNLADILRVAIANELCGDQATVMDELMYESNIQIQVTVTVEHWQIERRLNVHRQLIQMLRTQPEYSVKEIPAKSNSKPRRQFPGPNVDVKLAGISRQEYYQKFLKVYRGLHNEADFWVQSEIIEDDCMDLNIRFPRGRPKGKEDSYQRTRVPSG